MAEVSPVIPVLVFPLSTFHHSLTNSLPLSFSFALSLTPSLYLSLLLSPSPALILSICSFYRWSPPDTPISILPVGTIFPAI